MSRAERGSQQRHRSRLVERLVAVAALGRLHAARATAAARAALDHRQRRRQVPPAGGEAQLGDAHTPRDSRRRSRSSASPVSAWNGVETPPTSQRSQIVNSGRMPMPACSTACSVPGSRRGVDPRPAPAPARRRCTRRPGSPAVTAAGRALRARAPRGCGCRGARSRPPGWRSRRPRALTAGAPDAPARRPTPSTVTVSSLRTWVYSSTSTGSTWRGSLLEVELQHPVLLAEVQVDRARVDLLERPAGVDRADQAAVAVDDAELVRRTRSAGRCPAPANPGRPVGPAVAQPQRSVADQLADAVVDGVAPPRLVVGGEGLLVGGAGELGEQHAGVGRFTTAGSGRRV